MAMATAEDLELQERTSSLGGVTYGAPQQYPTIYYAGTPMFDPAPLPVLKPLGDTSAPAPTSPCSSCQHAPQPVIPSGGVSPTGGGGFIGLPGTGGPKVNMFAPAAAEKLKVTGAEGMGAAPWWLYVVLGILIVSALEDARRHNRIDF